MRREPNLYMRAIVLLVLSCGVLAAVGAIGFALAPVPGDEVRCVNKTASEFYRCVWEVKYGKVFADDR